RFQTFPHCPETESSTQLEHSGFALRTALYAPIAVLQPTRRYAWVVAATSTHPLPSALRRIVSFSQNPAMRIHHVDGPIRTSLDHRLVRRAGRLRRGL